ncbi:MAG: hypothetical protein MI799_11255 [Desulfobacterales bacterium]|nr:hypothetical protein [Desulfobacterales bacterium]
MFRTFKIIAHTLLILLVSIIAPSFSAPSVGDDCRKAVFLYIDVSGSMDVKAYPAPDNPQRKISLTQGVNQLLSSLLVTPDAIISQGDRLELKGFYSQTARLTEPFLNYDPLTEQKYLKEEIASAFRHKSRCIDPEIGKKTNFAALIDDLNVTLSDPYLQHRQILIIIMTDGGHDSGNIEQLRQKLKTLSPRCQNTVSKRTRLMFFRLPRKISDSEYEVSHAFKQDLGAQIYSFTRGGFPLDQIRSIISRANTPYPDFEFLSGPVRTSIGTYDFTFRAVNLSCAPLSLKRVCLTFSESDTGRTFSKTQFFSPPLAINPDQNFSIQLSQAVLPPRKYQCKITPYTQYGQGMPKHFPLAIAPSIEIFPQSDNQCFSSESPTLTFPLSAENRNPTDLILAKIQWQITGNGIHLRGHTPMNRPLPRGNNCSDVQLSLEKRLTPGDYHLNITPSTSLGDQGNTKTIPFKVAPCLTISTMDIQPDPLIRLEIANLGQEPQTLTSLIWEITPESEDTGVPILQGQEELSAIIQANTREYLKIDLPKDIEPGRYTLTAHTVNNTGIHSKRIKASFEQGNPAANIFIGAVLIMLVLGVAGFFILR